MEDKLKKYALLKTEEKRIAAEIKELSPEILSFLKDQKVDKLPTNLGVFTIGTHTTWKFSEAVKELEETEKATGIAKKVVTENLRFTAPKVDE